MADETIQIDAIRRFNRFYTRIIGLLNEGFMKSPFPLAEARVIHDIGKAQPVTARQLAEALDMDRGQLSRILQRLTEGDWITGRPDPADGRATLLSLTGEGESASANLNAMSDNAARDLLETLSPPDRAALVAAMQSIEHLLDQGRPRGPIVLRAPRIGEIGWLIHRQAMLYNAEQGWNAQFEALISHIYAEFEEAAEQPPKKLWIAEQDGAIAGSIFILPAAEHPNVAQLRMLYAEPSCRGQGIGKRLVDETISFSRQAGYERIMLWTQDCLSAARKLYQQAGFKLVREEKHRSFGADLNGQYWELELGD